MKDTMELCDIVRVTAFAVHCYHRHEHVAQVLGYLRASRIEHGLLLNFGASKFEIRKYVLSQVDEKGGWARAGRLLLSLFAAFAPFRG